MTTILEKAWKVQRGETHPPPIGRLLGFVLKAIEPGHAVFEMEGRRAPSQPDGHAARRRLLRPGRCGDGLRLCLDPERRRDIHYRRIEDQLPPGSAAGEADRRGK